MTWILAILAQTFQIISDYMDIIKAGYSSRTPKNTLETETINSVEKSVLYYDAWIT